VVTLAGRGAIARGGASILNNVGIADLIADSPVKYFQLATALAADLSRLRSMRQTLRDRMRSSSLMDAIGFTKGVEAAYRRMWVSYVLDGDKPVGK